MKLSIISFLYYDKSGQKELTQQLMREASFVTDFIVRNVSKFDFFDCKRINFICCDKNKRKGYRSDGRILEFDVLFDSNYFTLTTQEKTIYLYNLLYNSFLELCIIKNWNFDLLESVFEEFRNENYKNYFYTKLKCKFNEKAAELFCLQSLEKATFFIEVTNHKGGIERVFIFESAPHIFDYDRFLGTLKPEGNNGIVLLDKNGSLVGKAIIEYI